MFRILALTAALFALPASADEVWTTQYGDIVYQADVGSDAIWTFTHPYNGSATLVIPGLAGNFQNRGTHEAYWLGANGGICPAALTHPNAGTSTTWGRAIVSFDKPAFPSSLSVVLGDCFFDLNTVLRGTTTAQ